MLFGREVRHSANSPLSCNTNWARGHAIMEGHTEPNVLLGGWQVPGEHVGWEAQPRLTELSVLPSPLPAHTPNVSAVACGAGEVIAQSRWVGIAGVFPSSRAGRWCWFHCNSIKESGGLHMTDSLRCASVTPLEIWLQALAVEPQRERWRSERESEGVGVKEKQHIYKIVFLLKETTGNETFQPRFKAQLDSSIHSFVPCLFPPHNTSLHL